MANISYIRLLQAVELFSSEHMQVKRFASDFPAQMPNFGTENEKYPILFVSPNTNIFDENVSIFTIDIYCFDIIQKDRSNINTILSDTNLILSDLHRWLLDGEIFGIDINTQVTTTPIDNALLDYAAGWRMTATFNVDTYGICEIPFVNEPVILMEVNDVIYTTVLTCETLGDCDTFTDAIDGLQTQIDNIELIPGPTGPTGSNGATGPQGATGTSLLQSITPDAYLGPRLTPIDGSSNGFYINKSVNGAVGYYARNTENVGSGSAASFTVGGTGSLFENYASLFHANAGYFVPYLRGNSGLNSDNDFFFVGSKGAAFDFRTGVGSFGSETSKFAISNSGTVSIGIRPALDNTITDILGRKSDGSIIRVDKSSLGAVTSVGLSMPSAFNVSNSPITGSGSITVSGAGSSSQYVRGDGTLATLPTNVGGGSSVSYYLNGSINQGTIGGVTYYEMSKTPILDTGTDFQRNTNGYIASFLTDANDPSLLEIPAGNWNFETYFQASNGGGNPTFYIELYKYNGTTFSLIASNSATPKLINDGNTIEAYFSALAVPQTTLLATDRLAVRIYVTTSGRTITLHTENGHLCQVITTFSTGLAALNGLTKQVQYFQVGTTGSNFNISSLDDIHTFNLPDASATTRGALSSTDWTIFNNKQNALIRRSEYINPTLVSNALDYNGYAQQGSLESDNVWTITRLTITEYGTVTTGTTSSVAWTDRATVIYT